MTCYFSFMLNMFEAIKRNDIEKIKELIDGGTNVNIRNKCGSTPLHRVKSYEAAKLLLEHGADANAKNEDEKTPLHYVRCYTINC